MTTSESSVLPTGRVAVLLVSVGLMGLALTWAFLSMRVVMDVGGSCADGGPYVSAQPCPGGAGFIGGAIPLLVLSTFLATFIAANLSAPTLILPMWALLFGLLGWNFLDYGITNDDGAVPGFIICGVVFELMALPAVVVILFPGLAERIPDVVVPTAERSLAWWTAYGVAGAVGVALAAWSFAAWT